MFIKYQNSVSKKEITKNETPLNINHPPKSYYLKKKTFSDN